MAPDTLIGARDGARRYLGRPSGRPGGAPGCGDTSDLRTRIRRPGRGARLAALLLLLSPADGGAAPAATDHLVRRR